MALEREEDWIPAEGGIGLHAWVLRRADLTTPAPAITVAHGFAGRIGIANLLPQHASR